MHKDYKENVFPCQRSLNCLFYSFAILPGARKLLLSKQKKNFPHVIYLNFKYRSIEFSPFEKHFKFELQKNIYIFVQHFFSVTESIHTKIK